MLLTSRGRGVAVLQALADFEPQAEEREFLRAIVEGLTDLDHGRELDLDGVRARLAPR